MQKLIIFSFFSLFVFCAHASQVNYAMLQGKPLMTVEDIILYGNGVEIDNFKQKFHTYDFGLKHLVMAGLLKGHDSTKRVKLSAFFSENYPELFSQLKK